MRLLIFTFACAMFSYSFAAEVLTQESKTHEAAPAGTVASTGDDFSHYFLSVHYSYLDLIIPSKLGLAFGGTKSKQKSSQIEYLRGTLAVPFLIEDLGKITDDRLSYIKHSFGERKSFFYSYGLSYMRFKMYLGDEILNRLSGGTYPGVDLIEVQSVGFQLGIGNLWLFKEKHALTLNWVDWYQPVFITKEENKFLDVATDPEDRDDVETAIDVISYFPRLSFFKVGYSYYF